MDWITTANGLIALLSGLLGLIGAGIAAFLAIKGWIKATKEKSAGEIWAMIMAMADAAMKEAERSGLDGIGKKEMVIDMVKESCKAGGLNLDVFLDQLNAYIDTAIQFANDMNKIKKA